MKCKLLVAEDELIERKVLCKTLQKYLGDLISLYALCPRSTAGGGSGH